MQYVSIKKEEDKATGEIQYIVNALLFESKNGQQRKIPHPLGSSTIVFKTLEEAKKAIELAGFLYILPDGTQEMPELPLGEVSDYDKRIFDALIEQTKDLNPNIVATAISSLSEINDKKCLELYIEKIGEENENIRTNSIEAIFKYGLEALPLIFASLQNENWVKRNSAIICLEKFCEFHNAPLDKIIENLLMMMKDSNPIVKCSAIKALGVAYKASKKEKKQIC